MRSVIITVMSAVVLTMAGCAGMAEGIRAMQTHKDPSICRFIRKNVTTVAEAEAVLGKPTSIASQADGGELREYREGNFSANLTYDKKATVTEYSCKNQ